MIIADQSSPPARQPAGRAVLRRNCVAATLLLILGLSLFPPFAGAACTNCTTSTDGLATVVIFESGTGTFTPPSDVTEIEYLVVAGGGGGGGLSAGVNLGGAGGGGAAGMHVGTLSVTQHAERHRGHRRLGWCRQ